MRACIKEIEVDAAEGHTIRTLIEENTPSSENDTEGYIRQLVKCIKKPEDAPVSKVHIGKLSVCVAKLESQTIILP